MCLDIIIQTPGSSGLCAVFFFADLFFRLFTHAFTHVIKTHLLIDELIQQSAVGRLKADGQFIA